MSISGSVYLPAFSSVHIVSVCVSVCDTVCLHVCRPTWLCSTTVCENLSLYVSGCLWLSVRLSVCLHLSLCMYVCLVCLSVNLCPFIPPPHRSINLYRVFIFSVWLTSAVPWSWRTCRWSWGYSKPSQRPRSPSIQVCRCFPSICEHRINFPVNFRFHWAQSGPELRHWWSVKSPVT